MLTYETYKSWFEGKLHQLNLTPDQFKAIGGYLLPKAYSHGHADGYDEGSQTMRELYKKEEKA